jgi:hypothetical protein
MTVSIGFEFKPQAGGSAGNAPRADPQLASSCEQRKSKRTTTHPNQERVTVDV